MYGQQNKTLYTHECNLFLIKFAVSFMTVLVFPRNSISIIVQCQWWYTTRSWLHRRHGVWVRLVGIAPFLIIISLLHSTAGHRPLQFLAISLDPRLRIYASSSCQPFCANRHSTWPEGVLHYVYRDAVSTPELVYPTVVGSTADMASPLPLQYANTVCYVGDFRPPIFTRLKNLTTCSFDISSNAFEIRAIQSLQCIV
jgi:hypothetical protein